jgi:hypothetical protein
MWRTNVGVLAIAITVGGLSAAGCNLLGDRSLPPLPTPNKFDNCLSAHGGLETYGVEERCLLEGMTITENGQAVDFVYVPDTSLANADGGALAPQITNATALMNFLDGGAQPLDLEFNDPTASSPAVFATVLPNGRGPEEGMNCIWGCRATHRHYDQQKTGAIHYELKMNGSSAVLTGYVASDHQVIFYPVSSPNPSVDPVNDIAGDLVAGKGTPVRLAWGGGSSGGSGSSSGGSSGASSSGSSTGSSGGGAGACMTNADCNKCNKCLTSNGGVCENGACRCCFAVGARDPQTGTTSYSCPDLCSSNPSACTSLSTNSAACMVNNQCLSNMTFTCP